MTREFNYDLGRSIVRKCRRDRMSNHKRVMDEATFYIWQQGQFLADELKEDNSAQSQDRAVVVQRLCDKVVELVDHANKGWKDV